MEIDENQLFTRRNEETELFTRRNEKNSMFSEEIEGNEELFSRRLNVNTRLSNARIFDDDSNDSIKDYGKETKNRKMKTSKKNVKGSPYKTNLAKKDIEYEADPQILSRRQKQIDYGKNTIGYDHYRSTVPMNKRTREHPKTPVKHLKYSRRGWDRLIRIWRMKLHEFDPKNGENDTADLNDIKLESESEDE